VGGYLPLGSGCTLRDSRVSCLLITLSSSSTLASLSWSISPISGRICSLGQLKELLGGLGHRTSTGRTAAAGHDPCPSCVLRCISRKAAFLMPRSRTRCDPHHKKAVCNLLEKPRSAPGPSTGLAYTARRRRLSSITRAPCRKVMGVPGQRSQAVRWPHKRSPAEAGLEFLFLWRIFWIPLGGSGGQIGAGPYRLG
jgi:hypothetical protein